MENKKTHWRTVYKSDFLASWDLDDKDELLTIESAEKKMCKLSRGEELKVVINFKEKRLSNGVDLKPMICNPTNSKIISKVVKSGCLEDWAGYSVLVSVKENKGKIGNSEGLFIKEVSFISFDISEILKETDFAKCKAMANESFSLMSQSQVNLVKTHLKSIQDVDKK